MVTQPRFIRVLNTRPTFLTAPATGNFPDHRLVPGGNNVREDYLYALEELDPDSGPGSVWTMWKRLGWVKPMDVATSAREVTRPEGPEAPDSLAEFRDEAAEALVAREADGGQLARWLSTERRAHVRAIIQARLAQLRPMAPPPPPAVPPPPAPDVPPPPAAPDKPKAKAKP